MLNRETQRLRLRPHSLSNLERLHAWDCDPELTYLNDDDTTQKDPPSLDETRAYLERMCRYDPGHGVLHFAMHLRDGDEFIGYGMIAKIDAYNRSCLVGITIGERALWGQGLAHEALTAVIEFCFTALEMNRIGAEVFAFNTRSLRLLDGLGFRREGVRREAVLKKSRYEDEVIYGLLRREWEPTSSAPGRYVH